METAISPSLKLRLLSSLVLIPIVIASLTLGGWFFAVFIAIVIAIAYAEWIGLSLKLSSSAHIKILAVLVGTLYLGSAFAEMMILRTYTQCGLFLTLSFLFAVWSSDTGAYIFGKMIGGAKLCPTISPNKTWAGLGGAVAGPALILPLWFILTPLWAFVMDTPPSVSLGLLAICSLFGTLIGLIGQAGDLSISLLKRKAGVKDTGNLIPGHGGILDRIDSLLLALPVFLAFAKILLAP